MNLSYECFHFIVNNMIIMFCIVTNYFYMENILFALIQIYALKFFVVFSMFEKMYNLILFVFGNYLKFSFESFFLTLDALEMQAHSFLFCQ